MPGLETLSDRVQQRAVTAPGASAVRGGAGRRSQGHPSRRGCRQARLSLVRLSGGPHLAARAGPGIADGRPAVARSRGVLPDLRGRPGASSLETTWRLDEGGVARPCFGMQIPSWFVGVLEGLLLLAGCLAPACGESRAPADSKSLARELAIVAPIEAGCFPTVADFAPCEDDPAPDDRVRAGPERAVAPWTGGGPRRQLADQISARDLMRRSVGRHPRLVGVVELRI